MSVYEDISPADREENIRRLAFLSDSGVLADELVVSLLDQFTPATLPDTERMRAFQALKDAMRHGVEAPTAVRLLTVGPDVTA